MSEKKPDLCFESIETLRAYFWEELNISSSNIEGFIETDQLLNVLEQIEEEISIYCNISNTFLHKSVFQFLVFPRNKYGENMRFVGLAELNWHMLDKYLKNYKVKKEDLGFVQGKNEKVMSRFCFGKTDNHQKEKWVKDKYKAVSISELKKRIEKRKRDLGID